MSLWNKIKEIVRKMLPKKSVESVLHITPVVSDRMADAIQLWSDLYEGHAPWIREPNHLDPTRIVSLGLPSLIASEKARMVTLEMKSEISAPMISRDVEPLSTSGVISPSSAFSTKAEEIPDGSTERAEFLNKQYRKVLKQIRKQLEYGIAKGGLVIKPYIVLYEKDAVQTNNTNSTETQNIALQEDKTGVEDKTAQNNSNSVKTEKNQAPKRVLDRAEIEFDFVQADRFFPLSFDSNGKVVEAAFVETKVDKARERVFIRLEYHKLENHTVTVQNLAFESTDMNLANSNNIRGASHLGNQVPLNTVPEWSSLEPKTVIEDVDRLLLAYFKMPEANTIDPYSPLGVSGYSRVVQLIKDADMQYSRMLWEFEGGELAIDVDRDALKFVDDSEGGRTVLPQKQQRLFRKVDLNSEDTYNVFAPQLRDTSLVHGLNVILMRIEDATGLSRGTLSDINAQEAKTATELKILKQRSFSSNADIQYALQDALEDTIYIMDVYCTLYNVTPYGKYETSFEWDDSIVVDSESELSKRITLMQNGLASKLETRMWYFGETENQARQALQQVDEEATQAMLQNAQAQALVNPQIEQEEPVVEETVETTVVDENGNKVDKNKADEIIKKSGLKSPADTTYKKISKGKQADSLENPDKSKVVDKIKGNK